MICPPSVPALKERLGEVTLQTNVSERCRRGELILPALEQTDQSAFHVRHAMWTFDSTLT